MTINSRSKGGRGEREVIALLQPIVDDVYRQAGKQAPQLQRNSMQANGLGGCDIVGLPWLAIEVKRCETLLLDQWWQQCCSQAQRGAMPVLVYRQSKQPWKVRLYAGLAYWCKSGDTGPLLQHLWTPADISWHAFTEYLTRLLERRVTE